MAETPLPDPLRRWFLPRTIHPMAWWAWALGIAAAASATTNILLLVLLIGACTIVVMLRRGDAPWSRSFRLYLILAAIVVTLRVGFRILFGSGGSQVLLDLPQIDLPDWTNGMHLLGPVTADALVSGLSDGLRLATIIVAVGAANSLAHPRRLLRALPPALHDVGTVLVVAVSVFPQLAESLFRVRRAQALRGDRKRLGAIAAIGIPVLTDALDRSLILSASMDSRGYARSGATPLRTRRIAGALTLLGLLGVCVGVYGVLDYTTPVLLRGPVLLVGVALGGLGLWLTGRGLRVTRYRPDRWDGPALVLLACAIVIAAPFLLAGQLPDLMPVEVLYPAIAPPQWPTLAPLPLALAVVAALPAVLVPAAPLAGAYRSTAEHDPARVVTDATGPTGATGPSATETSGLPAPAGSTAPGAGVPR